MSHEVCQIGKHYQVPTVKGRFYHRMDIWPVIGPRHEDAEHIGFPHQHYHFDYRFMTDSQFNYVIDWSYFGIEKYGEGFVLSQVFMNPGELNPELIGVVYRRRKCFRQVPDFPRDAPFLPALSAAYADKSLVNGRVCPHRGADLTGLPMDEAGCATCPLHGLRWNMATGKLVQP